MMFESPLSLLILLLAILYRGQTSQRSALNDLYDSTNGSTWSNASYWKSVNISLSSWYGIQTTTDDLTGEETVVSILLSNNGLKGFLD
jgi:hypothetical protein